jgi:hypothetical protein
MLNWSSFGLFSVFLRSFYNIFSISPQFSSDLFTTFPLSFYDHFAIFSRSAYNLPPIPSRPFPSFFMVIFPLSFHDLFSVPSRSLWTFLDIFSQSGRDLFKIFPQSFRDLLWVFLKSFLEFPLALPEFFHSLSSGDFYFLSFHDQSATVIWIYNWP